MPVPAAVPPVILQGLATAVSVDFTSSRAIAWLALPTAQAAAMDRPAQPAHQASWSQISAYSAPTPPTKVQPAVIAAQPLITSSVAPNVQIHTSWMQMEYANSAQLSYQGQSDAPTKTPPLNV